MTLRSNVCQKLLTKGKRQYSNVIHLFDFHLLNFKLIPYWETSDLIANKQNLANEFINWSHFMINITVCNVKTK